MPIGLDLQVIEVQPQDIALICEVILSLGEASNLRYCTYVWRNIANESIERTLASKYHLYEASLRQSSSYLDYKEQGPSW